MDRFTVVPWLVVLFAGYMAMPGLNVYKVCAWNAGTLNVDPWRIRTAAAVQKVSQALRSWFASLWTPSRIAFASAALLLAVLVAHAGAAEHVGLLAVAPVATMKASRTALLRAAEALKGKDGTFANDAARADFDSKMAQVDAYDVILRSAEPDPARPSELLREDDPVNPGARQAAETEERQEPSVAEAATETERKRNEGILMACRAAKMPSAMYDRLVKEGVSLVDAQRQIFEELSKRVDPRPNDGPVGVARRIEMGDDPFTHARAGVENALLHRVNPTHFKLEEIGRAYRGMSLLDIARTYLNARGVRTTEMSRMELAGAALGLVTLRGMHTTSDFPYLLADVANKSLRADYEAAPQTFDPITRRGTVPDFKAVNRIQIGDAPALSPIGESGEFTRGTIEEGREQVQAASYGRVFAITRKALVNDDTDAFSKVPAKFGRMAKNLESDLVWYQILKNAAMNDTVALFHATHANYAGAGDISVANIGSAERAMLVQKGLDGVTLISAMPKYLIVPPTKKVKAQQFVAQITPAQASQVNPYAGQLTVIVEPRLEAGVTIGTGGGQLAATGSAYAWYLAADKNVVDIIELVFLEGQNGPVIESRVGFDVDGLEIKCRHDVGAKVIDYRGLYKSDGSDAS